jgi:hypothetical protein
MDGTVPGALEGNVRETRTFSATRFSRRHFQRKLTEAADELGVFYSAKVTAGLLLCEIEVTVEGDPEAVDRLRRYAAGLAAVATMGGAGGGGGA